MNTPIAIHPAAAQGLPPLNLLFEDEHFVAVDKPAGLLVHRSNVDKHETHFLLQQLRDQIGTHVFPVHRLDKPTSGVIVFAKSPSAAALLQAQMTAERDDATRAHKQYLLVCRGYVPLTGMIDHDLNPIDPFKSKRNKTLASRPAQAAQTAFTRLFTVELDAAVDKYPSSRYSLVSAELITGRKHQLRRHFKHLAHPIIGCPKYGKSSHNRYFADVLGVPRLLLHAYRLSFEHPLTQQMVDIVAPPSGTFATVLERFNWTLKEPAP